ncbi:hypothetical protein PC116_g19988 [Phytophthora cactorum]|uniref:Uncharacterized protein n=1 Tax=Phytophthora cactorum TaxID=29920 RepID=A0A8T1K5A8_9STRA|nr:hypothetical protein PC114_g17440 [Phytophthora cactorum]KAG2917945.1 hypothetical protein PC117_g17243 [Phytophthora cactorum]KAG4231757.1 hypothetical protein PC116_g19988 [Phytophthora cactorum]
MRYLDRLDLDKLRRKQERRKDRLQARASTHGKPVPRGPDVESVAAITVVVGGGDDCASVVPADACVTSGDTSATSEAAGASSESADAGAGSASAASETASEAARAAAAGSSSAIPISDSSTTPTQSEFVDVTSMAGKHVSRDIICNVATPGPETEPTTAVSAAVVSVADGPSPGAASPPGSASGGPGTANAASSDPTNDELDSDLETTQRNLNATLAAVESDDDTSNSGPTGTPTKRRATTGAVEHAPVLTEEMRKGNTEGSTKLRQRA